MDFDRLIPTIRRLALEAGDAIMQVYNGPDFVVKTKSDTSPVTAEDIAACAPATSEADMDDVLDIVAEPNGNDRVFEANGVRLYCDPKSYLYLNGTVVDYEQTTMGGGFKFTNPNAKRSCGCGTSFPV